MIYNPAPMRKLLICLLLLSSACWALERQSNADYRARREALARKADGGTVLVFAGVESDNEVYGFRQSDNFYYLSGWTEPGAALLVAAAREAQPAQDGAPEKSARPYSEILFLPSRDMVQERWMGPKLGADDPNASHLTGFDRVEPLSKLDEIPTKRLRFRPNDELLQFLDDL